MRTDSALDYLGSEWQHFQARHDLFLNRVPAFDSSRYWAQVETAIRTHSIEQTLTMIDLTYFRLSIKENTKVQ